MNKKFNGLEFSPIEAAPLIDESRDYDCRIYHVINADGLINAMDVRSWRSITDRGGVAVQIKEFGIGGTPK